jgi:hypothetical protein
VTAKKAASPAGLPKWQEKIFSFSMLDKPILDGRISVSEEKKLTPTKEIENACCC